MGARLRPKMEQSRVATFALRRFFLFVTFETHDWLSIFKSAILLAIAHYIYAHF